MADSRSMALKDKGCYELNFSRQVRQAKPNQNPESEYRNPKQARRQTSLKLGKSKTPNPHQKCFEFPVFQSFEFVSNFGFRASKFVLGGLYALCARYFGFVALGSSW
jgi:hypothetical protein